MGKLYDRLQKQLKSEEYKKDAEDCLKIYDKLKEMNNGTVWSSQWQNNSNVSSTTKSRCLNRDLGHTKVAPF